MCRSKNTYMELACASRIISAPQHRTTAATRVPLYARLLPLDVAVKEDPGKLLLSCSPYSHSNPWARKVSIRLTRDRLFNTLSKLCFLAGARYEFGTTRIGRVMEDAYHAYRLGAFGIFSVECAGALFHLATRPAGPRTVLARVCDPTRGVLRRQSDA